jgi:predicted house-cleaning noncanonical NTP pyrophosphatase (MazG superfamily)
MEYNKLIRDRIPEIIEASGKKAQVEQLSEVDYKKYLYQKLLEELQEFYEDESVEELADLLEVIYAVARVQGKSPEDLEAVRRKKLEERGGFERRLKRVEVE